MKFNLGEKLVMKGSDCEWSKRGSEGVNVRAWSRFEGGGWGDRQTWWGEWQTVTLLGFEAGCSAAAAIRLENNLAFLHRAAGREALSDCIRIVKNRRRSRLCKHASCLLPLLTNWRWFLQEGNKVGFFSCRWWSLKTNYNGTSLQHVSVYVKGCCLCKLPQTSQIDFINNPAPRSCSMTPITGNLNTRKLHTCSIVKEFFFLQLLQDIKGSELYKSGI